jgi:hypothetical protein
MFWPQTPNNAPPERQEIAVTVPPFFRVMQIGRTFMCEQCKWHRTGPGDQDFETKWTVAAVAKPTDAGDNARREIFEWMWDALAKMVSAYNAKAK